LNPKALANAQRQIQMPKTPIPSFAQYALFVQSDPYPILSTLRPTCVASLSLLVKICCAPVLVLCCSDNVEHLWQDNKEEQTKEKTPAYGGGENDQNKPWVSPLKPKIW
jgi:hypothetical protein